MAGAISLLILASWTKIEYAAFSVFLLIAATVVYSIRLYWAGVYLLSCAVIFVGVTLYFSDAPAGRHWLWDNVLAQALISGGPARRFYRMVSGSDNLSANLTSAVVGAAITVVLIALLHFATKKAVLLVVAAVAMAAAAYFSGAAMIRGWAILQLALLPIAFRRRDPILIVVLISICGSSRIFLRLFPVWYGFVFVIPTLILIASILFDWLPQQRVYSRRAALLWIIPVVTICAHLLSAEMAVIADRVYPVETRRGIFYEANRDRAVILNQFFSEIGARKPSSLVVMPEGVALNYLADVRTPISFHTFTPAETADETIEQAIIREIDAAKPELIAIVSRSVSDFGYRGFGIDYDQAAAAFIRRHYEIDRRWALPQFQMILLKRSRVAPMLSSPQ